ncbi:MAG: nucleotidyl transferase AbiEii/AbiGii toxin family protein [Spirochaetales bacterium]|jgi:predicted nucleotidyltransferase component of viral defense system|nr:nucleotidyl transferase AbiEii/AbiGii toxin family protein [Spirochaetales bacterium]
MSFFDDVISAALEADTEYAALRPVLEKEVLHHDILREMNKAGFLKELTFIGGTCLRLCYDSPRLSEDLDFTGGFQFRKNDLADLRGILKTALEKKYGLPVEVSEPETKKDTGDVETWKIKIITRPERPDFPSQRIHIDICLIPSHERRPAMLRNHYGIESGTSGMILFAESLEELLTDKTIALALRPGRVKNRDLWDIFWLNRKNITVPPDLLKQKIADRKISFQEFSERHAARLNELRGGQKDFLFEMRRFLKPSAFSEDFTSPHWWEYLRTILALPESPRQR